QAPVIDASSLTLSHETVTAGDSLEISVKITDNVAVDYVFISFWNLETEEQINLLEMSRVGETDFYEISLPITAEMPVGMWIVNDISAGQDDPQMLEAVATLGLGYVAMHKRGNPQTMDALTGYHSGVVKELISYFEEFAQRAEASGLKDWIIDPGLGFAKTEQQNWEILEKLSELQSLGRPILIGAADKRFTRGNNARAHELAILGGADILRVHNVKETKLHAQSLLQK
ncbi:MAG: dihydropteroate synthase, partial [Bacteroidales bacterium]|nr:dihydropteroate synthase [Bacteroidales bacterium]